MSDSDKVLIDYFGGTHGHFLEFMLNAIDDPTGILFETLPFNEDGTCRIRSYQPYTKRFHADHYSMEYIKKHTDRSKDANSSGLCIAIMFEPDFSDWLLYLQLLLLRSYSIENSPGGIDNLEQNTYTKLKFFPKFREKLVRLSNGTFNKNTPNCDRKIIRKAFLDHFIRDPANSLAHQIHRVPALTHKTLIYFQFSWFYDYEKFLCGLKKIAEKTKLTLTGKEAKIKKMHDMFLTLNVYAKCNSYQMCNEIFNTLYETEKVLKLNIIEEAYICKLVEDLTKKEVGLVNDELFYSTVGIRELIDAVSV